IFLHLPVLLRKYERGSSYIHTETMGRSYCEASASGLPAIGTSVGGVAEIIKAGHSGFLVEESDFVSAAQYLVRLIDNAELRLKMGQNARRLACQKFDWKIIFDQYIALFNEL
ncbi:MAG: glycosyltransferase family 4 protein, partial [Nanoarchaeota archaeon]